MKINKSKMRKIQAAPRTAGTVKVDLNKMYRTGMIAPPKVTASVRVDIEKMYELGIIERPVIPEVQPKWRQAWIVFTENVTEFLKKLDSVIYPRRKQVALGLSGVCGACLLVLCISSFPARDIAAEGTDAGVAATSGQYEGDITVTYMDTAKVVSEPELGEMSLLVKTPDTVVEEVPELAIDDGFFETALVAEPSEAETDGGTFGAIMEQVMLTMDESGVTVEEVTEDADADAEEDIIIEETEDRTYVAYEAYEEEEEILEEEEESKLEHAVLAMAVDTDKSIEVFVESDENSEAAGLLYSDSIAMILEQEDGWTKIESGDLVGWVADENLLFDEEAREKADEVSVLVATVEVSALNVREEPGTNAAILGSIKKGDEIVVVDEAEDSWAEVEYKGETAYINTEYAGVELRLATGETMEVIEKREEEKRLAEESARKAAEEAEARRKAEEEAARAAEETDAAAISEMEAGEPAGTTGAALSATPVASCTQEELNMLAAIIYCEAGNQPYNGKVAVGSVVLNRLNSAKFPNTIEGVIRASGQFSPVKSGKFDRVYASGSWSESCYQAALDALAGVQPVGNAYYFKNPKIAGAHSGITIADHVFW